MPDFSIEQRLGVDGLIFGLDEAGRGPWCGPVVAACACWKNPQDPALESLFLQLNDSKKLSAKKREKLFPEIMAHAVVGIGQASAQEIDEINILQASFLAMHRALEEVMSRGFRPAHALIDGNRLPQGWDIPCSCIIGGDGLSLSIAAASIVAKVTRDRLMVQLADKFPAYGWERNAGYGTKDHINALKVHGVTIHHRRSYAPIKKLLDETV